MGTLFVNKSGCAFKITRTNGGSDVIGTLPVNAIFAWELQELSPRKHLQ